MHGLVWVYNLAPTTLEIDERVLSRLNEVAEALSNVLGRRLSYEEVIEMLINVFKLNILQLDSTWF